MVALYDYGEDSSRRSDLTAPSLTLLSVMSKLSVHSPSPSATSDQDIVKCNKLAIKHKCVRPNDPP